MDVAESLRGIFRLCQFFGLLPYSVSKSNGSFGFSRSKAHLTHTKITFAFYFLMQAYLIWYGLAVNALFLSERPLKTVMLTSTISAAVSNLVIFRSLITSEGMLCHWLNRINEIFSSLNGSNLKWVKTISVVSLVVNASFMTCLASSEVYLRGRIAEREKMSETFLRTSYVMVTCFYVAMWEIRLFLQIQLVLVSLVRFHYKQVHGTLSGGADNGDRIFWLDYIRDLRLRHLEMQDFLDFVQSFFMPVTSCRLLWGFFNLLFNVMAAARTGVPPVIVVVWFFYNAFDMVVIISVCHATERESSKTLHCLQELFIEWDDTELQNEVEIFSLQVQHKKIEFTALGFSTINFTLLYKIIGALTSTAVVLLQFQNETFLTKEFCSSLLGNLSYASDQSMVIMHSLGAY